MNEFNSETTRRLDLGGLNERIQKREAVKKEEQQKPQQIDAVAAYRLGLRSYLNESYREAALEKLKGDPALTFFLTQNRSPETA